MSTASNKRPLAKSSLEKLSSDLVESPKVRAEFMADPQGFIKKKYGVAVPSNEVEYVENLKNMVADGFCCKGCGCSAPDLGKTITNPSIKIK